MSEKLESVAENLVNNIIETVTDAVSKQKTVRFSTSEESTSNKVNKLLGRQKSVHHVLGGGKSADVLLWRNKKISSSVLGAASTLWAVFEWLDYHFLTLVSFVLILGLVVQFLWSHASGFVSSSGEVPRVKLPEELFVNIGVAVGTQVNKFLDLIQDISCGGNLKQFLIVIVSLWAAAVIGSWCNFLTVIYIGFVSAHTLPVLYEKYQDQGKCKCLIVRYIPDDTREDDLRLVFGKYGRLDHVTLPRHRDTGKQHTFAYVEYHSADDASKARSRMDSRIFLNCRINVDYAYDQKYQERRGVISGASYQYGSPQPYRGRRSCSRKRSRSRSSRYRGRSSRSYSRAPRDRENHHVSSRFSNSKSSRRTPDEMRRPKSIIVCGGAGGASAPASAGGSAAAAAEEKKRRREGAEEEERRRVKRGREGGK